MQTAFKLDHRPSDFTVVWVSLDGLKAADANPAARTTRTAVRALAEAIRNDGWNRFAPVLVSTEGVIGDGNRRYAAAKLAGCKEITAIFTDMTFAQLIAMNRVTRRFGGADWLRVYVNTDGQVELPNLYRPQVEGLEAVLGMEGMRLLADKGAAPDIWTAAFTAAAYVGRRDNAFLRKLVYWSVKHKMRRMIIEFTKLRGLPALLIQAVENDYPLRLVFAAE